MVADANVSCSLNLADGTTYLVNTSNKADRLAYVLRQQGTVNSWFGGIQYSCHFNGPVLLALLNKNWEQNATTLRGKR